MATKTAVVLALALTLAPAAAACSGTNSTSTSPATPAVPLGGTVDGGLAENAGVAGAAATMGADAGVAPVVMALPDGAAVLVDGGVGLCADLAAFGTRCVSAACGAAMSSDCAAQGAGLSRAGVAALHQCSNAPFINARQDVIETPRMKQKRAHL